MKKQHTGFTLIELLIVVAIIAILAAIAVPNFLEAQIRAKVSRAQADIRSMAVGLESYVVDNNKYPPGYLNVRQAVLAGGGTSPDVVNFPASPIERSPFGLHFITTPVAYINNIFQDPFTQGAPFQFDRARYDVPNGVSYWYDDYQPWPELHGTSNRGYPSGYIRMERVAADGYTWSLSSAGPLRATMMMWFALDGEDPASANNHVVFPYDPTNGTLSEGFIARTNKGVYTELNQD